jgi:hypothetical protein
LKDSYTYSCTGFVVCVQQFVHIAKFSTCCALDMRNDSFKTSKQRRGGG